MNEVNNKMQEYKLFIFVSAWHDKINICKGTKCGACKICWLKKYNKYCKADRLLLYRIKNTDR